MIFKIEKRHEFEGSRMFTHWDVRSYTHVSPIGVLMNGKTLKKGTKTQCEKFCRTKNIIAEAL